MTQNIEIAQTGLVIVDHGSRREESNAMLETFVERFRISTPYPIVEPAHMELAEPSIATALDRCVARGARRVVIAPYFLAPGRHWQRDIPRLAQEAAAHHPGLEYMVTAPIGLHPLMQQIIQSRIDHCVARVAGEASECEICSETSGCQLQRISPEQGG